MANVVVTVSGDIITVDFGVYGDGTINPLKATYDKKDITKVCEFTNHVLVSMMQGREWQVCYTSTENYLIVDSIDAVAPSSNSDLYDKLKVLVS